MANEEMQQQWSESARGWVANARTFDAVSLPFTEAILSSADIQPEHLVLDIGCGTGALLHRAIFLGATPVGVDISETMAQAAHRHVPKATVVVGDAETIDFISASPGGRPFDRVVSRFGVMFFDDPVAAFQNILRATAPGAVMTFVCWRNAENPMLSLGTELLAAHLGPSVDTLHTTAAGPLAFGDAERVRAVLEEAGWGQIAIEPFDGLCDFSTDTSNGVEERLAIILSTETGRRAQAEIRPRLGRRGWDALLTEVRTELRQNLVDGAMRVIGRTWIVGAVNPAVVVR